MARMPKIVDHGTMEDFWQTLLSNGASFGGSMSPTQHQPTKLGWVDNEAVVIQRPLGMAY